MTTTRETERRGERRKRTAVAAVASLLAHVCLVAVLGPGLVPEPIEPAIAPPTNESFTVETSYEEEPDPPEPEEQEKPAVERVEIPVEELEEQPLASEVVDQKLEHVEQQTNEEMPEVAEKISDQANAVEEEDEPSMEPGQEMESAASEAELDNPEEATEALDPVIRTPTPLPPHKLFPQAMASYDRVFAESEDELKQRVEEKRLASKKTLMPGYEQLTANVKKSLMSHGHAVKPGNHYGVNAYPGSGSYVGNIHRKIHLRWANGYLLDLDLHEPVGSPMNNPELNAKLEFVIRAEDGAVEAVNIVQSSGQLRFDAQAIAIANQIGPHPNPPPEIVSPNGKVYIHWNFWRDQRQCGVFGASVFIVEG